MPPDSPSDPPRKPNAYGAWVVQHPVQFSVYAAFLIFLFSYNLSQSAGDAVVWAALAFSLCWLGWRRGGPMAKQYERDQQDPPDTR